MMERSSDCILENVKRIRDTIAKAAAQSGRSPDEVKLMAVTKTVSVERVNEAIEAGVDLLGENRVQEMLSRCGGYQRNGLPMHFIGHLQSNKAKQVVGVVDMVESLDSLSLAAQLNRCAESRGIVLPVLVEVNIAGEESKSGVVPDMLGEFIEAASQLKSLHIEGLMSIPPRYQNDLESERYFDSLRRHFIDIGAKNIDNVSMKVLSMGMSEDYHLAIKHGSNVVRIGRALFNERM